MEDYKNSTGVEFFDREEERKNISEKRAILTIGIPTYNRAEFLRKCLESIYNDIGNSSDFQVLICDNNSTDNTFEVVNGFKKVYNNLVYYKNNTNIGVSKNIQRVLELAEGEYINLHGDDDYFNPGIYNEIIKMIASNNDCNTFYLNNKWQGLCVKRGHGMSSYQVDSGTGGWITGMVINVDAYKEIVDKEKFLYSNLNHIYIQMEMIRGNPNYCILSGLVNRADTGSAGSSGYNIFQVAIKNYLDIMYNFENNGLTSKELAYHKYVSLDITFPLIRWIIQARLPISIDGGIEIFTEYYKDEPYFEARLKEITEIVGLKI